MDEEEPGQADAISPTPSAQSMPRVWWSLRLRSQKGKGRSGRGKKDLRRQCVTKKGRCYPAWRTTRPPSWKKTTNQKKNPINPMHRPSNNITRATRWRALRLQALRRDGYQCLQCGTRYRLEVDHIKAVRHAPELGFELSNLQTLCISCHSRKTRLEIGHPDLSPGRKEWRAFARKPLN